MRILAQLCTVPGSEAVKDCTAVHRLCTFRLPADVGDNHSTKAMVRLPDTSAGISKQYTWIGGALRQLQRGSYQIGGQPV